MTRRRWLFVVVAACLVLTLGAATLWVSRHEAEERLASAELLAGGAERGVSEAQDELGDDLTLDDLPIADALLLATSTEDQLLLYFELNDFGHVVRASPTGEVDDVIPSTAETAVARSMTPQGYVLGAKLLDFEDTGERVIQPQIHPCGEECPEGPYVQVPYRVTALANTDHQTVILGSGDDARIAEVEFIDGPGGPMRPSDEGYHEIVVDETEPPITHIAWVLPLPDDRVVFVGETANGPRLYVLERGRARPVRLPPSSGVRVLGLADVPEWMPRNRAPVVPLAAGPEGRDGTVILTGLGARDQPVITSLDVDTGRVEVLADLEGVDATLERPVVATAVGDDLVFLADGRLWRLDGAFA